MGLTIWLTKIPIFIFQKLISHMIFIIELLNSVYIGDTIAFKK